MSLAMHRTTTVVTFLLAVCTVGICSIPLRTSRIVTIPRPPSNGGLCRGTVVDTFRIVTVASCVRPIPEEVQEDYPGPGRKVLDVVVHPTADLSLLYVDDPFPVNDSLSELVVSMGKPTGGASVDTASGLQEVPILKSDPCSIHRQPASENELFSPSICDTALGSPVFQVLNNKTILIGMIAAIPSPCQRTPCRLHMTDISHHRQWLLDQPRGDEPGPSLKLPKIPATVVFSFLKLLAVVSSLGGISFAFCCVMFLISN